VDLALMSDVVPFRRTRKPSDTTAFIGMAVFLGGWAMMFAALFFAYALVRTKAPSWPPPGEAAVPVALPAFNTLLLVASSVVLALGLAAVRGARPRLLTRLLVAALALGGAFLALQLVVWRSVWLGGLRPDSGIYGSVFYALTVFHGLHVLVGLVGIALLLPRALGGRFTVQSHTPVRLWAMYWHFVDVIWLVMFLTVYVL
jgi:cytochrome c oxidase subunit 3